MSIFYVPLLILLIVTKTKELLTVVNIIVYPVGKSKKYEIKRARVIAIEPKIVAKEKGLNLVCVMAAYEGAISKAKTTNTPAD